MRLLAALEGAMGKFTKIIAGLWLGSAIISLINRIGNAAAFQTRNSTVAGVFLNYCDDSQRLCDSFVYNTLIKTPKRRWESFKRFTAASINDSLFCYLLRKAGRWFFCLSMGEIGALSLVYGSAAFILSLIKVMLGHSTASSLYFSWLICIFMVVAGILCFLSGGNLSQALLGSRVASFILFDFFGIRRESVEVSEEEHQNFWFMMIGIGVIFALLTWSLPVWIPFALLVMLFLLIVIFFMPEAGVLVMIAALPFLQTMQVAALAMLVFVSFLVKLLRGKRSVKWSALEFFILIFCLMLLYGGVFSMEPNSSVQQVLLYFVFIAGYFVVVNTIASMAWVRKAAWVLILSATLVALIACYQYFGGGAQAGSWIDIKMFAGITARASSTFENPNVLGEYLIMCIPVSAAMIFASKRFASRVIALGCTGVISIALVLTWSRGAWLGLVLAAVVMLLLFHRVFVKLAIPCLFALPFLPAVLPDSVANRFLSIGNMADSSTAYRVSIWEASLKIIKDFWNCGIGVGSDVFMQVYPSYALSGAAFALHSHNLFLQLFIELGIFGLIAFLLLMGTYYRAVFTSIFQMKDIDARLLLLACGIGILAFLVQGLADNVWFNFRIFCFFWLYMGLGISILRGYNKEWGEIGH